MALDVANLSEPALPEPHRSGPRTPHPWKSDSRPLDEPLGVVIIEKVRSRRAAANVGEGVCQRHSTSRGLLCRFHTFLGSGAVARRPLKNEAPPGKGCRGGACVSGVGDRYGYGRQAALSLQAVDLPRQERSDLPLRLEYGVPALRRWLGASSP